MAEVELELPKWHHFEVLALDSEVHLQMHWPLEYNHTRGVELPAEEP